MVRTNRLQQAILVCAIAACPATLMATPIWFGPTAYLDAGDEPSGFFDIDCHHSELETFEDNSLHDFLSIDNGSILLPNSMSGATSSVTDSVDGDDGMIDGNGNGGHSWFYGLGKSITITFDSPVTSAGVVWTDGPDFAKVLFEAFDENGDSLGIIGPADIADDFYTGETAEDHFFGIRDDDGIGSIMMSITSGMGIEIDHIMWQDAALCVPEPTTLSPIVSALAMLILLRARRRNR